MKATANSQSLEQFFKTVFTIIIVQIIALISNLNTKLMAAGANFATTLATIVCFLYLYKYYKERSKDIGWKIYHSSSKRVEGPILILKKILKISIPMSFSSILTSINKNVDSVTVIRGLKRIMTEKEAKIQYGILSGKVDTLVTFPLSFNIAFATALVPAISASIAKRDYKTIKKRISFSLLIAIVIGMPCTFGMVIFAKPILDFLFPNASMGANIFRISAMSIIFIVLEQTVNRFIAWTWKNFCSCYFIINWSWNKNDIKFSFSFNSRK